MNGNAAKSAEIRSRERQVCVCACVCVCVCVFVCKGEGRGRWCMVDLKPSQAAIERAKRRESLELAAMQAYEQRLQQQQEETKKKSAGVFCNRNPLGFTPNPSNVFFRRRTWTDFV